MLYRLSANGLYIYYYFYFWLQFFNFSTDFIYSTNFVIYIYISF